MANGALRPRPKTRLTELHHRWNIVERLIISGMQPHEIIVECDKRWGVSHWTATRYMEAVRRRWQEEREHFRGTESDATIVRLTKLAQKLERKEAFSPLVQVEKLLADVRGVKAPEKHQHLVGTVNVAPRASLEVLDTASDAFLDELERLCNLKTQKAIETTAATVESTALVATVVEPDE